MPAGEFCRRLAEHEIEAAGAGLGIACQAFDELAAVELVGGCRTLSTEVVSRSAEFGIFLLDDGGDGGGVETGGCTGSAGRRGTRGGRRCPRRTGRRCGTAARRSRKKSASRARRQKPAAEDQASGGPARAESAAGGRGGRPPQSDCGGPEAEQRRWPCQDFPPGRVLSSPARGRPCGERRSEPPVQPQACSCPSRRDEWRVERPESGR